MSGQKVSRSKLWNGDSDDADSDEASVISQEAPAYVPDFVFTEVDVAEDDEKPDSEPENEADEEAFAFNLFSGTTSKDDAVVVISKAEEAGAADDGSYEVPLVNRQRPESYYFAAAPTESERSALDAAAVTYDQVRAIAALCTAAQRPPKNPRKILDYTALALEARAERLRERKRRRPGKKTRERAKKRAEEIKKQRQMHNRQRRQFKSFRR